MTVDTKQPDMAPVPVTGADPTPQVSNAGAGAMPPASGVSGWAPAAPPAPPQTNAPSRRRGFKKQDPKVLSALDDLPPSRAAYRYFVEELKVNIVQVSNRNMDNTMRLLRNWLNAKK